MRRVIRLAAAVSVLMLVGCAGERSLMLRGGPQAPAAEGSAMIGKEPNGNTRLKISVKHLAPPEKVVPGTTVFAVWARPLKEGAEPQNLGCLKVDENLEGRLETVTPLKEFDLMITPEATPDTQRPRDVLILSTRVMQN